METATKETSKKVLLISSLLLLLLGAGIDLSRADETVTDVPPAVEEVAEEDGKWWNPKGWKEKYNAWSNKDEEAAAELARLRSALDAAKGQKLFYDEQVEALESQNASNQAFYESIIAELKGENESLSSDKAALEKAMRDYQDKDNNLMYVEGCWVPINTGQKPE